MMSYRALCVSKASGRANCEHLTLDLKNATCNFDETGAEFVSLEIPFAVKYMKILIPQRVTLD